MRLEHEPTPEVSVTAVEGPSLREELPPRTRSVRQRRARAAAARMVGRALVVWAIGYIALRLEGAGSADAAVASLVFVAGFLPALQWAAQARVEDIAYGVVGVDALGVVAGTVLTSALLTLATWLGFDLEVAPVALGAAAAGTFVFVVCWDLYARRSRAPTRALLIVDRLLAENVFAVLQADGQERFRVVGVVGDQLPTSLRLGPWPTGPLSAFEELAAETGAEVVVVAVSDDARPDVYARVLGAAALGFTVLGLPELYEVALGRLPVRQLTPAWFMGALHHCNRPYGRFAKRLFDVSAAVAGLTVAIPLIPFVILVIKRTPGPILFRQRRVGEAGQPFTMLKFRSMVDGAESDGARFAGVGDARVIPGGGFIRRTRLDEIPQLWNVLRGEMSFVGPRPERLEFVERLAAEVPYWTARNLLKPGITGWAQIKSGYAADDEAAEVKLSYDLWYLRHRSLALDLMIVLRTVGTIATGAGAR